MGGIVRLKIFMYVYVLVMNRMESGFLINVLVRRMFCGPFESKVGFTH